MRSGKFIVAKSQAEGFVSLELDGELVHSKFVVETPEHCAERNGAELISGPFNSAREAQANAAQCNTAERGEIVAWAANDAAKRKAEEIRALQQQRAEVVRADSKARGLPLSARSKPAISRRVLANATAGTLAHAEDALARKAREQREKFAADARRLAAKRSAAGRR